MALHVNGGHTGTEIIQMTGLGKAFVYKWINKPKKGEDHHDQRHSGRPLCITQDEQTKIIKLVKGKRAMSTRQTSSTCREKGMIASPTSIYNILCDAILIAHWQVKQQLLTNENPKR